MRVVGLATTLPRTAIEPWADVVIVDYEKFSVEMLLKSFPDTIDSR